eukprot:1655043-Amphidinium_carterae.1
MEEDTSLGGKKETPAAPLRTVRESTRRRTLLAMERERASDEARGARKVVKRVKAPPMSQRERLEAAAHTERQNLEELQARRTKECAARRAVQRQSKPKRCQGPRIRFVSRQDGAQNQSYLVYHPKRLQQTCLFDCISGGALRLKILLRLDDCKL